MAEVVRLFHRTVKPAEWVKSARSIHRREETPSRKYCGVFGVSEAQISVIVEAYSYRNIHLKTIPSPGWVATAILEAKGSHRSVLQIAVRHRRHPRS